MANKEVTDRDRSTTTAVSMMSSYAEQVGEGATAVLSPYLEEGEVMPDMGLVMTLLARMANAKRNALADADAANERERADDAKPRADRDRYKASAFALIVTVRDSIAANYGVEGLAALGIREPCPSTTLGTAHYGRALIGALRDPKVALPPPRSARLTADRAGLAEDLEAEVAPLEAAVNAVAVEESEAKGTQSKKDAALAANDECFSIATGLARHSFRLCGLTDLANRIIESSRNPGQLDVPPPPPEDVTA